MAPMSTVELKRKAKELGMPVADIRTATHSALEKFVQSNSKSTKSESSGSKRKAAPTRKEAPVARKKAATKKSNSTARKQTPAAKKKAPAKRSAPATARKTSNSNKPKATRKAAASGQLRNPIGKMKWNQPYGTREGSVAETIFEALKDNKGDVDAAFDDLKGQWKKLAGKGRGGVERTKEEALSWLRYRLNRIKFDYGIKTGQHDPNPNSNAGAKGGSKKKPAKRTPAKKKAAPAKKPAAKKAGNSKRKSGSKRK